MRSKSLKRMMMAGLVCGSIASLISVGANAEVKNQNVENIYNQEAVKLAGDNECSEAYKKQSPEWKKSNGRWTYFCDEGKGKQLKDTWYVINGYWYHFDKDGYMNVRETIKDDKGNECVLNKDGVLINRDEPDINHLRYENSNFSWKIDNGNYYCYDSNGKMITGWVLDRAKWYYFNENGIMQKNITIIDGVNKYKLGPDGVWNGLFDGSDVIYDNTSKNESNNGNNIAWINIDGDWYAKRDGVKLTGLQKDENGKLFYMDENGVMQNNKMINVDGIQYVIDGSGVCTKMN